MPTLLALLALPILALPISAQYTATYSPSSLPDTSQQGQSGTNACGTTSSDDSTCQNLYMNSVDDFCVWGPPGKTSDEGDGTSKIGNVEQVVVSYCLNEGYGTRLIPSGTISSAHFVKVINDEVSYVQVTGTGDFTKILIPAGDDGGELDPHSWTGLGNPQGGLVFSNAFNGSYEQTHEWTSFIGANTFCVRACRDGPNAPGWCQHIYDTLDCGFTVPGSMDPGFDDCSGDPALQPGVYDGATFSQGDASTPAPHPAGPTSACSTLSTVGGGTANLAAVSLTGSANATATANAAMNATMTNMASNATMTTTKSAKSSSGSSTIITAAAVGSASAKPTGGSAAASASSKSAGERVVVSFGAMVGGLVLAGLLL